MLSADLDLSKPSFNGARYFAVTRMREAGRSKPDDSDRAELARLLFHVEGDEGGFLRLGDEARAERAAQLRLPIKIVESVLWATGVWPVASAPEPETREYTGCRAPSGPPHYLDPMALICASALTDKQLSDPARMACASTIERVAMEEVRRERAQKIGFHELV